MDLLGTISSCGFGSLMNIYNNKTIAEAAHVHAHAHIFNCASFIRQYEAFIFTYFFFFISHISILRHFAA